MSAPDKFSILKNNQEALNPDLLQADRLLKAVQALESASDLLRSAQNAIEASGQGVDMSQLFLTRQWAFAYAACLSEAAYRARDSRTAQVAA